MNESLAKWVLKKTDAQILFFCGSLGKSLSRSAIEYLISKSGKTIQSKDVQKELMASLAKGGTKTNVFLHLLKTLFGRTTSDLLLLELHGRQRLSPELLAEMRDPMIILPWISPQEIEEVGGIKEYLKQYCLLTKRNAKFFTVIYNKDIPDLEKYLQSLGAKQLISFGVNTEAEMKAEGLAWKYMDEEPVHNDHRVQGMICKVRNGGSTLPLRLQGSGSVASIYSVLSALCVAQVFGMNLVESLPVLRDYKGLAGRWRFIPGIKKSLLVDDTYDSNLESAIFTFTEAGTIELEEGKKRFAVISDMPSAGANSEQFHCYLGTELAQMPYDYIIGIGERCSDLLHCAEDAGMDRDHLMHFLDVAEAGKYIQHQLKIGDLVVIKGSKELPLEPIVKELMAFPLRAKEDLVVRG